MCSPRDRAQGSGFPWLRRDQGENAKSSSFPVNLPTTSTDLLCVLHKVLVVEVRVQEQMEGREHVLKSTGDGGQVPAASESSLKSARAGSLAHP